MDNFWGVKFPLSFIKKRLKTMSRIVKPLTNTAIQNLKPTNKEYTKSDGNGLYIRVRSNGSKYWYFSYKFLNRSRKISLGEYPFLSLAAARELAQTYKSLLLRNIDPVEYLQEQKNKLLYENITLSEMAKKWKDKRISQKKFKIETINEAYRRIEIHILPVIGNVPIKDVSISSVMPALEALKNTNTLYKINVSLKQILQMAEDEDLINKNPLRRLHEEFNYIPPEHQPTIAPHKLPSLFRALNNANIQRPTALLIEWQLLTMLRPAEAVSVEWSEIDFENDAVHIPAEKMKGRKRAHSVPLSKQALYILKQMRQFTGNRKHIFASYSAPYDKPMSTQSANVALKRMGFKGILVSHGLRSIASTYLHELDRFSSEAIELCLAHENKGKVRAAYDRSRKWKARKEIMQEWGDYVESCKIEAIKAL